MSSRKWYILSKNYCSFFLLLLLSVLLFVATGCSSAKTMQQSSQIPFETIKIDEEFLLENLSGDEKIKSRQNNGRNQISSGKEQNAKIMITGDNLIHDLLYMSALNPTTGTYNFDSYYEEAKTILTTADFAIGDFEGTMSPAFPLCGYPLFNCPPEMAMALNNAGYDLMSLANNHICDSNGSGIISTKNYLKEADVDVFGVHLPDENFIKVFEINGIKFAFMAYSYGFNGMEASLTYEEQQMLSWINPDKIKKDIQKAKQMADMVLVFPHMGIEYQLLPNKEQISLYHDMIDWGADFVIGNHPHVLQPIEIYQDKFILYSLGNFISNQRVETGLDIWTERGIILELNFSKKDDNKVNMVDYVLHPTWVRRIENGKYSPEGYPLCDYKVLLAEKHLDDPYIKEAHDEVIRHLEHGLED